MKECGQETSGVLILSRSTNIISLGLQRAQKRSAVDSRLLFYIFHEDTSVQRTFLYLVPLCGATATQNTVKDALQQ